ncbi:hypothetical protein KL86DYS2_12274 [uncultured Dysgonomonas sp.]|uniref:Uncharacterized protein n=1 Tax=uncultured Dysgonomonas sp. TaxID=206096 RepID=A0A212JSX3_9BACT|nr:hypothetical protein [uncultured Dysgonomonas sp.]SBW02541.1 hypothetical protein KL86DYS2_12274 [uncultured Dysgonomonas sp.]
MKNINIISILLLIFSVFTGCEYDKNDIYIVDIQKPVEKRITFNLADLPSGTTIYIYQKTNLMYDLNLPEGDILKRKLTLGGRELLSTDGYIVLDPKDYNSRTVEKLTLDVEVNSGSESIAGKLGLENYIGTFEYEIVFIPDAVLGLQNIAHHKNKDDYFELTWSKPQLEQYTVEKYRITYYHDRTEYIEEILNPDQTVFVDTRAVFGYLHYRIETFFKESYRQPWVDNYTTSIEFPKYSVKFEYTGINSGRISWPKNEYKSKYAFARGYYGDIIYEGTNNYFEIEDLADFSTKHGVGIFPISYAGEWVELYVLPMSANTVNRNMPIHYDELHSQSLITRSSDYENYIAFIDTTKDILFIKNQDELWSYNSNTLEAIDNRYLPNTMTTNWNVHGFCSEKSSTIFIPNYDCIDLISYDLKNHEKIQFESTEALNYQYAYLGTNDIVFIYSKESPKLYAYDLNSRKLISSLSLDNMWGNVVVSRDGKYVCLYNDIRALVYKFSDNVFSLLYTEEFPSYGLGSYDSKSICFNEKISNQLIVTYSPGTYSNEMYTVDIENNSKSEKKRYSYRCSDPYTGNIVATYGATCTVFDTTLTKERLSLKNSETDYLINNLFLKSGWGNQKNLYYLDITNYFKK